jgi:RNA polymerase sigma factor (sigma-70 family)
MTLPARHSTNALIVDVLKQSDVSVRLSNAITVAASRNELPCTTVDDYLKAGPWARARFLRIANLGQRSADELDQIIRDYVKNGPSVPEKPSVSLSKSDELREGLVGLFTDLRYPDFILDGPTSTRLANALHNGMGDYLSSCADLLRDWPALQRKFLAQQNVGRTSIEELHTLLLARTNELFTLWGFSKDGIVAAQKLIFEGEAVPENRIAYLQALVWRTRTLANHPSAVQPPDEALSVVMESLLSELSPREREVLERRYGFGTHPGETLEDVAVDYGVTRERIRQIEAKALRRLSLPRRVARIRKPFEAECPQALAAAAFGLSFVRSGEENALIRRLPANIRLAVDVLFPDRRTFLGTQAIQWESGWLIGASSTRRYDEALQELQRRLPKTQFPIPLSELCEGLDEEGAIVAIELATPVIIFEGYALLFRASARRRRTVRLHRTLVAAAEILDIRELVARYRAIAPDDPCSPRDAIIVMIEAPHLFMPLFDNYWTALGRSDPHASLTDPLGQYDPPALNADQSVSSALEERSIREILRHVLVKKGPLRFVDLRDQAGRELDGKSSRSIGPILLTSGEFVRPLPGIYALPEQVPPDAFIPFKPPAFLLTDEHARWFAMARHAGEPFGTYPLWIPGAEYALCRWARTTADPLVFQSLLSAADPSGWPVANEEKDHWRSIKASHARYNLAASPRYPISQLLPSLDRLLAACLIARRDGGLSWMTANRILKRRIDAHVSAGLLALMIAAGLLEAPDHWQGRHKAAPALDKAIVLLAAARHQNPELSWNSSMGETVRGWLRDGQPVGWLTQDLRTELMQAASVGSTDIQAGDDEADESAATFDVLLKEAAELDEKERTYETLNTLAPSKQATA